MNISGSGRISAGEYNEKISVSGSGKIDGKVRCKALSCSGSVSGSGELQCVEEVHVSGAMKLAQDLSAQGIHVSGSLNIGGECIAQQDIKVSGIMKCHKKLKCTTLKISGGLNCEEDIEAENVKISGGIQCTGLLNAENVEIEFGQAGCCVGSIGGSNITILARDSKNSLNRLALFSKLVKNANAGTFQVQQAIEGDVIAVEKVNAPLIVGRVVAVGAGCQIDLVQYSEEIEVHPDATVKKLEKI